MSNLNFVHSLIVFLYPFLKAVHFPSYFINFTFDKSYLCFCNCVSSWKFIFDKKSNPSCLVLSCPYSPTHSQLRSFQQHGNKRTWHLFINLVTAIRLPAIAPSVSQAYRARLWKDWSKRRFSINFRGTILYLICNMASYLGDPALQTCCSSWTVWSRHMMTVWFQTLSSSTSPKRLRKSLTSPSSTSYKLMGFVVSFCSGSTHFSPTDLSAWRLIKHCHLPLRSTLASHKALSSGHFSFWST